MKTFSVVEGNRNVVVRFWNYICMASFITLHPGKAAAQYIVIGPVCVCLLP